MRSWILCSAAAVVGMAGPALADSLYGTTRVDGVSTLVTVDMMSGVVTPVGAMGFDVRSLAYNPVDGVLYGTDTVSFYRINMFTGAATRITASGSGSGSGSASTSGSTAASGSGSGSGSTISPDYRTGAITSIGFDPDGLMYAVLNFGTMYNINTTTGSLANGMFLDNTSGALRMAIGADWSMYMIDQSGNAGWLDLFDGNNYYDGSLTAVNQEVLGTAAITYSTEVEPLYKTKAGSTGGTGSGTASGSTAASGSGSASGSTSTGGITEFAAGTLFGMVDLYDPYTESYTSVIGRITSVGKRTGIVNLDYTFSPRLEDGTDVRLTGMAFAPTAVVPSPAAAAGGLTLAGGYVAARVLRGRRGRRGE